MTSRCATSRSSMSTPRPERSSASSRPSASATPLLPPEAQIAIVAMDLIVVVLLATRRVTAAGEQLLLAALFLLVPPLPAFAISSGSWHGLRHLARLAATNPANTRRPRLLHVAARCGASLPTPPTDPRSDRRPGCDLVTPGLADQVAHGRCPPGSPRSSPSRCRTCSSSPLRRPTPTTRHRCAGPAPDAALNFWPTAPAAPRGHRC